VALGQSAGRQWVHRRLSGKLEPAVLWISGTVVVAEKEELPGVYSNHSCCSYSAFGRALA